MALLIEETINPTKSQQIQSNRMLVFGQGEKTGVPGENPSEKSREPTNKLNPHITAGKGIEPGPRWEKTIVLTPAPTLL